MWLATFSNQNKRRGSSSVTSPRVLFDIQMLRKKNTPIMEYSSSLGENAQHERNVFINATSLK